MWPLFRKYSFHYITFIIPILSFMIWFRVDADRGPGLYFFILMIFWTWLLISGSISNLEKYEEKHNGYKFLKIMGVPEKDIVSAKFLLALAAVLFLTVVNIILSLIFLPKANFFPIMRTVVILWAGFCLMFAAVMYIGVFKFGFSKMLKVFWMAAFGLFGAVILADIFLPKIKINLAAVIRTAGSPWWLLLIPAGLAGYYLLYLRAVKVLKNREEA